VIFIREASRGKRSGRQIQLLAMLLEMSCLGKRSGRAARMVGSAFEAMREKLGVSQDVLAARIGQSRITVSRWERGAQNPGRGLLKRWARDVGVTIESGAALVTLVEITPRILSLLREDPNEIHRLSPS
jgi:DNA-binding transcriptional regulator YiaG